MDDLEMDGMKVEIRCADCKSGNIGSILLKPDKNGEYIIWTQDITEEWQVAEFIKSFACYDGNARYTIAEVRRID